MTGSGDPYRPELRLYVDGEPEGMSAALLHRATQALYRTLKALADEGAPSERVDFKLTRLGLNSLDVGYAPLHGHSSSESNALEALVPGLQYVSRERQLPPRWPYSALNYASDLIKLYDKEGATGLTLTSPSGETLAADGDLAHALEEALSGSQTSLGAVTGHVHAWRQSLRESTEKLTVRDEATGDDVDVRVGTHLSAAVHSLVKQRVVFRGKVKRDRDGTKRTLDARSYEILSPRAHEPKSILDFDGIMGPLPEGFDVVEWQRNMREA